MWQKWKLTSLRLDAGLARAMDATWQPQFFKLMAKTIARSSMGGESVAVLAGSTFSEERVRVIKGGRLLFGCPR
eukprot:13457842-Alexandrium_andersonii.AAC.1